MFEGFTPVKVREIRKANSKMTKEKKLIKALEKKYPELDVELAIRLLTEKVYVIIHKRSTGKNEIKLARNVNFNFNRGTFSCDVYGDGGMHMRDLDEFESEWAFDKETLEKVLEKEEEERRNRILM